MTLDYVKVLEDRIKTQEALLSRGNDRYYGLRNQYESLKITHERFRQEYYKLLAKVKVTEND